MGQLKRHLLSKSSCYIYRLELHIRQYELIDLDYGFTYPKFLDLKKTFIF